LRVHAQEHTSGIRMQGLALPWYLPTNYHISQRATALPCFIGSRRPYSWALRRAPVGTQRARTAHTTRVPAPADASDHVRAYLRTFGVAHAHVCTPLRALAHLRLADGRVDVCEVLCACIGHLEPDAVHGHVCVYGYTCACMQIPCRRALPRP